VTIENSNNGFKSKKRVLTGPDGEILEI
jgi:hypothetical protein